MIEYLLFLIARTCGILLLPFGVVYSVIRRIFSGGIGQYFIDIAYAFDVLINTFFGDFFNDIFKKRNYKAYRYGNPKDSISKVLGKNMQRGQLTKFEWKVCRFLNWLDKDHVQKAARQ